VIWAVVFGVGLLIGLAVGRWGALLAAMAFGVYITPETDVELSPVVVGLVYALFAAAGIDAGVLIRRRLAK
jgi:prolipoprotein diacylglyceryltransferase